jgi:hypothetical protein
MSAALGWALKAVLVEEVVAASGGFIVVETGLGFTAAGVGFWANEIDTAAKRTVSERVAILAIRFFMGRYLSSRARAVKPIRHIRVA